MTHPKISKIAEDIAHDMMTNNFGDKAERLVLEAYDGSSDHGGRCEQSVIDVVTRGLENVVVLPYKYESLSDEKKRRLEDYIRGLE